MGHRSCWACVKPWITYVTFTYIFPFGLCGCLLKYRLHSLADTAPCNSIQHRRRRLLHWEATWQDRNKILCSVLWKIRTSQRMKGSIHYCFVLKFSQVNFQKWSRCQASFELLNVVKGTALTWSVEHHENRPLLPLQQLPEILREDWRFKSFIILRK